MDNPPRELLINLSLPTIKMDLNEGASFVQFSIITPLNMCVDLILINQREKMNTTTETLNFSILSCDDSSSWFALFLCDF